MSNEHEALKPCPFCGGEANVEVRHSKVSGVRDRYFPSCLDSDCAAFIVDPYSTWATKREAIAAWNTRATPSPSTDEERREAEDARFKAAILLTFPDRDFDADPLQESERGYWRPVAVALTPSPSTDTLAREIAALKLLSDKATGGEWYHYDEVFRPQFGSRRITEIQRAKDGKSIVSWSGFDGLPQVTDRKKNHNARFIVELVNFFRKHADALGGSHD
jgi:hypothetical protein